MPSRKPKPRSTRQPVSKGLKGFADARKPSVDLLKEIQKHVVAQGIINASEGREAHKIHVSELVKDTCARQLFYKVNGFEPTNVSGGAWHQLEMIWAAGAQEHLKWQNWLREMGDLWGSWTCLACGNQWEGLPRQACGHLDLDENECDSPHHRYDEVNLVDPEYPLVGHADGAVPRLNALVEIKSFSAGSVRVEDPKKVKEHSHKVEGKWLVDHDGLWKSVKRPLASHRGQGLMYLWMAKRMGLPYDRIIFIYENKTTQATKTFELRLTDRLVREYIDVLDQVVEAKQPPARPELFAKDSRPCKDCPFNTLCWENDATEETSPSVSTRRPRSRSEAPSGGTGVRSSAEAGEGDSRGARRSRRTERPGTAEADDRTDSVGRASRRATGVGRGGRALGRSSDGESEGPRFTRKRQGRDRA